MVILLINLMRFELNFHSNQQLLPNHKFLILTIFPHFILISDVWHSRHSIKCVDIIIQASICSIINIIKLSVLHICTTISWHWRNPFKHNWMLRCKAWKSRNYFNCEYWNEYLKKINSVSCYYCRRWMAFTVDILECV